MARCEQGYLCQVCGQEVEQITESDLYLAYVVGEVEAEWLHRHPERHIRCNLERAQYIVDENFPVVECPGLFDKRTLDPDHVASEERRLTRAWRWLQQIPTLGLHITQYPLPPDETLES
jgi:hypothetical protein